MCAVDNRCKIRVMWTIPYLGKQVDEVRLAKMLLALGESGAELALLEHQQPHAKEGAVGAHSGGAAYGAIRMGLAITGIVYGTPYEILRPEVWKRQAGIPVPSIPKANLPAEPTCGTASPKSKKDIQKTPAWKAWKKACDKIRATRSREVKKRRKELSCALAQRLQPNYDFRKSTRAKGPHDGKCEAFLLAREAWKKAERISDDAT